MTNRYINMNKKSYKNIDILLLKKYLPDYLINYHKININNFFNCLNKDHQDIHPSMKYSKKYNICKCFSCGVRYDIFDLMQLDFNCETFKEQIKKVLELYNNKNILENNFNDNNINELIDYTKYYNYCCKNINKTNYLQRRGIDKSLIKKYCIGFDIKNNKIIFPINKYCYFSRSTIDNGKYKSKGKSYLWNENILDSSDESKIIYITESIIDALSLLTIKNDINVISLNGLYNANRLLELVKEKNLKGNFVLVFDKDAPGLKAQIDLQKQLSDLGIRTFNNTLISNFDNKNCKDVNESLILNKSKLKNNFNFFDSIYHEIIDKKNQMKEREYEL